MPDRAEWLAAFRRAGERTAAAVGRTLEPRRRELAAERRALDRLDPRAQLAADRERVGPPPRSRGAGGRGAIDRRGAALGRRGAGALRGRSCARLGAARRRSTRAASALAVLDPRRPSSAATRSSAAPPTSAIVRAPDGGAAPGRGSRSGWRRASCPRRPSDPRVIELVVLVAAVAAILVAPAWAIGMLVPPASAALDGSRRGAG